MVPGTVDPQQRYRALEQVQHGTLGPVPMADGNAIGVAIAIVPAQLFDKGYGVKGHPGIAPAGEFRPAGSATENGHRNSFPVTARVEKGRTEGRLVGTEGVSTCRSRWSRCESKKKKKSK